MKKTLLVIIGTVRAICFLRIFFEKYRHVQRSRWPFHIFRNLAKSSSRTHMEVKVRQRMIVRNRGYVDKKKKGYSIDEQKGLCEQRRS